jgi:hypothetical protein
MSIILQKFLRLFVLTATICFFTRQELYAQNENIESEYPEPQHHLGADVCFTMNDVFIGGIFHYADPFGEGYSLVASIIIRPYGKKELIRQSPNVYLYLREERFSILLGIDRQWYLEPHTSLFINALGGVTVPRYRGSDYGKSIGIFPVITVGLQFSILPTKYFASDIFVFRVGGQYLNLSADKFRIYSAILMAL